MRKKMILVLLSLCLLFVFPFSVFASESYVEVDSQEEFDAQVAADNQELIASFNDDASPLLLSEPVPLDDEPFSFVPDVILDQVDLDYNTQFQIYFDYVKQSNVVAYAYNGVGMSTIGQISTQTQNYIMSGFEYDSTYTGVLAFTVQVPRPANNLGVMGYINTGSDDAMYEKLTYLSNITPLSVSCRTPEGVDCPVYFLRQNSSDGKWRSFTFYVVVQDMYIGKSNGVVEFNNLVLSVEWGLISSFHSQIAISDGFDIPPAYCVPYAGECRAFTRTFSGIMRSGRHTFDSDVEQELQEQLVNGYENESGAASIETGAASVESGVSVEHDALGSAGSMAETFDYSGGDLTELAAAFSLISGWFTSLVVALGSWNMLIYVSLTMVVALFAVGYFRNR